MTHTFSKSAFYSFGDIPLAGPLPIIFSHLLISGGHIINLGKVTIGLIEVNPISYDKDIIDLLSKIVRLDLYFSPSLLVQEGTYLYRARVRLG